jgi:hypothetical protein
MINAVTGVVSTPQRIKIAILGRENGGRLAGALRGADTDVELYDRPVSFIEASNSANLLLIDCTDRANLGICRELASNGAPVVAIIDNRYDGWLAWHEVNITGYISINAGDGELTARLAALLRFSMQKKKSERFREVPQSPDTS